MAEFDILVVGDRRLQAFLHDYPASLDARIEARFQSFSQRLAAAVQAAEPQRTGRLRGETRPFVRRSPAGITAGVQVVAQGKVDIGKAAALEYGAHGSTKVAEHWATRATFWGRYASPRAVLIEEYQRRVNIGADRYLRGPFDTLKNEAVAEIERAIAEAEGAA